VHLWKGDWDVALLIRSIPNLCLYNIRFADHTGVVVGSMDAREFPWALSVDINHSVTLQISLKLFKSEHVSRFLA